MRVYMHVYVRVHIRVRMRAKNVCVCLSMLQGTPFRHNYAFATFMSVCVKWRILLTFNSNRSPALVLPFFHRTRANYKK